MASSISASALFVAEAIAKRVRTVGYSHLVSMALGCPVRRDGIGS
jgi:hypothetical protein